MNYTITEACDRFDEIRVHRENWLVEQKKESFEDYKFACLELFAKSSAINELSKDYHVDSDVINSILETYSEHLKFHKKDGLNMTKVCLNRPTHHLQHHLCLLEFLI